MQGSSRSPGWTPPSGTLGELTAASAERARDLEAARPSFEQQSMARPPVRSLRAALRRPHVAVLAEVKRQSPSKGAIAPGLDAVAQARAYVQGGAAAISVLTEPQRFGGSLDDLRAVAAAVSVPVLRKDFIVHPAQLWEARACGADAALLIVRALAPGQLRELVSAATAAGVETLLEVRDEAELQRALDAGATLIGVNNRDLETLVIDPTTAPRLIPGVPRDVVAVAESGITTARDAEAAVASGADALLVGSAISAASDPAAAVAALACFPRRAR